MSRPRWLSSVLVAASVSALGCGNGSPTGVAIDGTGTRILFIGNSHTYVNDVPGILQALADSAGGESVAVASYTKPGYALIDHWLEGEAQREIARGVWKWVVLQQGWTPAGIYRDTLRIAVRGLGAAAAAIGATTALYQIWPQRDRQDQWPATIESYRVAAADVNGVLFPAAEAWQAVWSVNPGAELYGDLVHASRAGSYLAALTMYARIFHKSPVGLPASLRTHSGALVSFAPAFALQLQQSAADVAFTP